jgi:hypothetical protein
MSISMSPLADRPAGISEEDILLAVLHKVQGQFKEEHLITALDEVARKHSGMFLMFQKNPNGGNRTVWDLMRQFATSGSLIRQGMTDWFRVSPHTYGAYGRKKFDLFTPAQREEFKRIAWRVSELARAEAAA